MELIWNILCPIFIWYMLANALLIILEIDDESIEAVIHCYDSLDDRPVLQGLYVVLVLLLPFTAMLYYFTDFE